MCRDLAYASLLMGSTQSTTRSAAPRSNSSYLLRSLTSVAIRNASYKLPATLSGSHAILYLPQAASCIVIFPTTTALSVPALDS